MKTSFFDCFYVMPPLKNGGHYNSFLFSWVQYLAPGGDFMFFVFSIFASGSFTSRVRAGVIPRCSTSGIACSEAKILFFSNQQNKIFSKIRKISCFLTRKIKIYAHFLRILSESLDQPRYIQRLVFSLVSVFLLLPRVTCAGNFFSDGEIAKLRDRERNTFFPVAERGTSSARQWTVCRAPLIMDKSLPGAPFF